jgi:hypothetical protein
VRQRLLWATCVAAIAAGTGSALAMPLGPIAPAATFTPVQYWGDWGPRYERPYVEPYYGRRYITPDDDDDDIGMIAPRRAIAITRSMGYRAISRPRLAGRAWVVEALGPQGQRTRVSINAYTGAPLAIRELEPGGQRFPTPPVWRDERPGFGRDTGRSGQDFREGRLDNDPQRLERPERPARPGPNITARIVPVPTPRPDIDGGLAPRPQVVPPVASPPPAEQPAPQPPAARLSPRDVTPVAPTPPLSVEPRVPFTPPTAPLPEATPVAPPAPEPPTAALPQVPDAGPREEQPSVTAPPAPETIAPPVEATRPADPPQPPTAALPPAPAPAEPPAAAPIIEAPPVQASPPTSPAPPAETAASPAPAPAETAARPAPAPEPEGTLIDGRFLGPNGEPAAGSLGQPGTPGVRQVAPPPASN